MIKNISILSLAYLILSSTIHADKKVVVDLAKQQVYCYENGNVVMKSRVSSGKNGYRTPNGKFYIMEKKKKHNSNKYDNASMPNMMRLTNYGVAMHAGNTARPYASHGCIRLPHSFSNKVFNWANVGTPVHVYGGTANTIKRKKIAKVKKSKSRKNRYAIKSPTKSYNSEPTLKEANVGTSVRYEYKSLD